MKTFLKSFFCGLVCVFALSASADLPPVLRLQWTTNSDPVAARGGLGAVALTQTYLYFGTNSTLPVVPIGRDNSTGTVSSAYAFISSNAAPTRLGLTTLTTNAVLTCPAGARSSIEFDCSLPTGVSAASSVVVWWTNSAYFGSNVLIGAIGNASTLGGQQHYYTLLDPGATFRVQTVAGATLGLPVISNFRNIIF